MDEFEASGGSEAFSDRVAENLGIDSSNVIILSIREGSVIVDYEIIVDEDVEDPQAALEQISQTQTELFATGGMDLGAPLLDVQV